MLIVRSVVLKKMKTFMPITTVRCSPKNVSPENNPTISNNRCTFQREIKGLHEKPKVTQKSHQ